MTGKEKETVYKLLTDHFDELDLLLKGIWEALRRIDRGDAYEEPEGPRIVFCGIETKEDFENQWDMYWQEQNLVLKAMFDKDMIVWFIRDNPKSSVRVWSRIFHIGSDKKSASGYYTLPRKD